MTRSPADPLRVVLLLPDVLGSYSDRGNALVLAQRARWRGIPVELVEAPVTAAPPTTGDVYVLGGGEDAAQVVAARWIAGSPGLRTALGNAQVVAVCAGLQLLGVWTTDRDGQQHAGAGVLDLTTAPAAHRAVGEVVVDGAAVGGPALTGFENHLGHTSLGPGLAPLGRVLHGTGNGDGADGVLTPTVVGTYLHGPVLARNPHLADLVLRRALGGVELPDLEVPDEQAARDLHLRRQLRRRRSPAALLRRRPGQPVPGPGSPAGEPAAGAPPHVVESIDGARGDQRTSTEAMRWVPPDRVRRTGT